MQAHHGLLPKLKSTQSREPARFPQWHKMSAYYCCFSSDLTWVHGIHLHTPGLCAGYYFTPVLYRLAIHIIYRGNQASCGEEISPFIVISVKAMGWETRLGGS